MNIYSLVLFLHITGALGYFAALGLEWVSLAYLHRAATAEQAREWLGTRRIVMPLGMASLGLILLTGLFMMATSWGLTGWIAVALASLLLIAVLGAILTGRPLMAIGRAVGKAQGALSPAQRELLNAPLLWISMRTRTAIALGVVFLMAVKPGAVGSFITIGIAIVLGLASSLPLLHRDRSRHEEALT